MADKEFDRQDAFEGISLEVTDQSWRLVASTRSLIQALPPLMGGTFGVGFIGLGVWVGSRQQIPSFVPWFLPLFLTFVLAFVCLAAMRLGGRIEIAIVGGQGTVFTGVRGFGRTQYFNWSETMTIKDEHMTSRGGEYHEIVLHAAKKIRTGKFLTKEQSRAILQALRQLQRSQRQLRETCNGN